MKWNASAGVVHPYIASRHVECAHGASSEATSLESLAMSWLAVEHPEWSSVELRDAVTAEMLRNVERVVEYEREMGCV